jgi:5'(3')-deoxyribonucleotidase
MINYLQKNEIDIMFCTTPILYGEELWSLTEKAHWLRKHFGNWALRKLTLTSDKTTVIGKILIDDKEKIDGDENPTWTHILFDQPWNQSSESIRMKGGWTKENMDWLLSEFINK